MFGFNNKDLSKIAQEMKEKGDMAFFEDYKALCEKHKRQIVGFLDINPAGITAKTMIGMYNLPEPHASQSDKTSN